LRIIIFVDREAETDDRREEEEGRREIRIYEGQLEGEYKKPPAVEKKREFLALGGCLS